MGRLNPVTAIAAFNAGREPERLALKYRAMRSGPFPFMRGSCHLFYARLGRGAVFRSAPAAWCCGDLHLQNFGSYKGDNRLVYFDINDFDEAALAPASWDLVRMLCSWRVGVAPDALGDTTANALCQAFLDAYCATLACGKAQWVERDTASGLVGALLEGLRKRKRKALLDARTRWVGKRRSVRTDNGRALPATDAQARAVRAFMAAFAKTQPDPAFYDVVDVARRVAGTGSLGVERFIVLVAGKGSPDGNYLLDLKQSRPSSLLPHLGTAQPAWASEAARVTAVQRMMQPVSVAFLHAVLLDGMPCVLSALQPSEDRVTVAPARQSIGQLAALAATMGGLVASAQLRTSGRHGSASADGLIDFGNQRPWRDRLLAASLDCATQVLADHKAFCSAFDDGLLAVDGAGPRAVSRRTGPRP